MAISRRNHDGGCPMRTGSGPVVTGSDSVFTGSDAILAGIGSVLTGSDPILAGIGSALRGSDCMLTGRDKSPNLLSGHTWNHEQCAMNNNFTRTSPKNFILTILSMLPVIWTILATLTVIWTILKHYLNYLTNTSQAIINTLKMLPIVSNNPINSNSCLNKDISTILLTWLMLLILSKQF